MKAAIILLIVGVANAALLPEEQQHKQQQGVFEERRKSEHVQREHKTEHYGGFGERERKQSVGGRQESVGGEGEPFGFTLDERTKEILLKEKAKAFEQHEVVQKVLQYYLSNPNRQVERECFAKFQPDESIDFVIDLAPSPSEDKVDKQLSESPIGLYLALKHRTPSSTYFSAIEKFIEVSTFEMKPESTHSIIYENGQKYYIRGKKPEVSESLGGDFSDMKRNLRTMWPVSTKEVPDTLLHPILNNNLGRMTKLALWNRNNGLATVLGASRRSKPIYTIVITDGASGAKITDLVDESNLQRTTVIDIGNHRFVKNMSWNEMKRCASVVTLSAPQQLPAMADTVRTMACRFCA